MKQILVASICCSFAFQQGAPQPGTAVLWRDPGAIGEKDLRWGAGGPDRQPAPPLTFVREDVSGSKPQARGLPLPPGGTSRTTRSSR